MKFCRFCGAQLPDRGNVKFCPKCGKNLSVVNTIRPQQSQPIKEVRKKYIQPKPISPQRPGRPQVDKSNLKSQRIEKQKVKNVITTKGHSQTIFEQRLKSNLDRLDDSISNLHHIESYQLADHSNLIKLLDELKDLQGHHLFSTSQYAQSSGEMKIRAKETLVRISEFLTSHLDSYGLVQVRKKWFILKEKLSHSELDSIRIEQLGDISNQIEKSFNLLDSRLESAQSGIVKKSTFFAAYPQVYHYYFRDIKPAITEYIKQIDSSGFYSYYRRELKVLKNIKNQIESPKIQQIDPALFYQQIFKYLDLRAQANNKIEIKIVKIQREIVSNQEDYFELREKYIKIMEKVIKVTDHDILMMRPSEIESAPTNLGSLTKLNYDRTAISKKIVDIAPLAPSNKLSDLSQLEKLNNFSPTRSLEDLKKLDKTNKLNEYSISSSE